MKGASEQASRFIGGNKQARGDESSAGFPELLTSWLRAHSDLVAALSADRSAFKRTVMNEFGLYGTVTEFSDATSFCLFSSTPLHK
jgi:hypothetical protein